MRELVEHDELGARGERRFEIEILEGRALERDAARGQARQPGRERIELGTALRLDPADRDANAGGLRAQCVLQQTARLPRPRGCGEVHGQAWGSFRVAQQRLGGRPVRVLAHGRGFRLSTANYSAWLPGRSASPASCSCSVAFALDLVTPQLFVAAILLNAPIALSSLVGRPALHADARRRGARREPRRGLRQRHPGRRALERDRDRRQGDLGALVHPRRRSERSGR